MTTALVSYAPSSLAELEDWAKRYAGAFSNQYRNRPQDAVLAVMWGSEIGLKAMQSLAAIAVINGKPALFGDWLVALAERSGKIAKRHEGFSGTPYADTFTAWCECTTIRGDVFRQEFSVADAKRAKLWGKAGPWTEYPRRMLQIRPRNFCIRDAVPDLGLGPSAEEMRDVEDNDSRATKARDVTPPRSHEDGTPYTPHEEVDAAIEEAHAEDRVKLAEEELQRDPIGINGSTAAKAAERLVAAIVSARTAAEADQIYDTYRPRITKMPTKHYDLVSAAMAKRIEDEARRGEGEEFADILDDEGELIGPDE